MKKLLFAVALIVVVLCAAAALCACGDTSNENPSISDQCLRIHIRANSNSEEDQTVKLKVRDNLTAYFTEVLKDCKCKAEAYDALCAAMPEIENIAEETLENNGYTYGATVTLGSEHFPVREYDGYVFPEGDYDALIVGLGTATGDNWWCVAFPPLCFVPTGDGEEIVYKSWVKEIIDKIFNND